MSNLLGGLLNQIRIAKKQAIEDMTDNLLRKHMDFDRDKVLVQEITLPDGTISIRVSLREGFNDIDFQTANIRTEVTSEIIRTADLPEHHPDYEKNEKNKKLQEDW